MSGGGADAPVGVPLQQQPVVHREEGASPRQHPLAHGIRGQAGQLLPGVHQQPQARRTTLGLSILGADGQGATGVVWRVLHASAPALRQAPQAQGRPLNLVNSTGRHLPNGIDK
ncbi:hypothetical protein D3C72_1178610 [compost metagenome]